MVSNNLNVISWDDKKMCKMSNYGTSDTERFELIKRGIQKKNSVTKSSYLPEPYEY